MDRSHTIVSAIYGYTVCLIAILLFVAGSVGFVNNAFRTANPGLEGSHYRMGVRRADAPIVSAPFAIAQPPNTFRGGMIARGRLNAVRGLVVSLVVLIISIVLFRWHWGWLNAPALQRSESPKAIEGG
jgi:hypothetical protein